MTDRSGKEMSRRKARPRGLSTIATIAAVAVAVVLAFLLNGVVGFPENLPLAFGAAVLLAEMAEIAFTAPRLSGRRIMRAVLHAVVVAAACWLGVWTAGLLGWTG